MAMVLHHEVTVILAKLQSGLNLRTINSDISVNAFVGTSSLIQRKYL